jgi:hypothetical protein
MKIRALVIALVLLVGAVAGCSSGPGGHGDESPQKGALVEVSDLLRAGTRPNGRGPASLVALAKFQHTHYRAYEAIKSGEVIVLWGYGVKGEGEMAKGGGDLIAYEKGVPTNGGYVLLSSGEVKQMSAAEFAAAPKTGKK